MFFIDLVIYISVMFLVREIRIPNTGFITNGLINSFTTLVVASLIMRVRGVTWKELGLTNPKNLKTTLMVTGFILVFIPVSIMIFELIKDQLPFLLEPDTSEKSAVSKFGDLKGNWTLFFSIITFILVESFLEELLDRGFLMNWFERLFSKTSLNTILAVIFQAAIFGFRHSYDLSERSITVGLIGLIMGIAYMAFGRNLWPLIIAHCILNTMSMLERVI
tara:strand:+ start:394 stop:1053 length:660 start_codon:yes stop_codon:yes gene_type:complete